MSVVESPSFIPPAARGIRSRSGSTAYALEDCPFETVMVDVTHRCNMACKNCYIPNRTIPDLDAGWLREVYKRLPRGRFIRLVGAEPTVRRDLPDLIRDVKAYGHHPVVLTNGLKLVDRAYAHELKLAGLRVIYLSMNGGLDEDLYEQIDDLRCGAKKVAALENLCAENFFISIGMIVVRGLNERESGRLFAHLTARRQVREFHLRSVGPGGRYMETDAFRLTELFDSFCSNAGIDQAQIKAEVRTATSVDFSYGRRLRVQLTQWPDFESSTRGRLTPEGTVERCTEHVIANLGEY